MGLRPPGPDAWESARKVGRGFTGQRPKERPSWDPVLCNFKSFLGLVPRMQVEKAAG